MLTPVSLDEQVDTALDDRLRVLVVGAGVAGVTLAQLLRRQGLHPVLLERSDTGADVGYMLGLMPLVDEPLRSLGAWDEYVERSVAMHRYQLRSSRGRVVRTYSLDRILADYGRYSGIERGELLAAISGGGSPATLGATVTSLAQNSDGVVATMDSADGAAEARFDVLVAADGMHSATRALVLGLDEVQSFDTGWGGWVAWAEPDPAHTDLYVETWGRGLFVRRYPVQDRVGVFVWHFADTRSSRWAVGRVVLLGDAAAGFLPTAGIGAAMALESAWVLAARLNGVAASEIPQALREYERQQRPRVLAAHDNSRQLARMMFRQGRAFCTLRDIAMRVATLKMALGPIIKLHQSAPVPR